MRAAKKYHNPPWQNRENVIYLKIPHKLSSEKSSEKKLQKNFWKGVDKRRKVWYNKWVVWQKTDNEKASWKLNNQEYENPWKYFELINSIKSSKDYKMQNVQWNETEILNLGEDEDQEVVTSYI